MCGGEPSDNWFRFGSLSIIVPLLINHIQKSNLMITNLHYKKFNIPKSKLLKRNLLSYWQAICEIMAWNKLCWLRPPGPASAPPFTFKNFPTAIHGESSIFLHDIHINMNVKTILLWLYYVSFHISSNDTLTIKVYTFVI